MEEWKVYENNTKLFVSNMGRVKKVCSKTNKEEIIKPIHHGKLLRITVASTYINVHTLVAEVFIPNPDYRSYVKHKNGDSHDNRVSNLEWSKRNGGRPRKNTEGITISTETFTTGTIELSDRYSSVSTHDEPVVIADYRIEYIKSISKWSVFRIIDDNTIEYKGIHDSKDEAEMAIPDEVYQNEPY